MALSATENPSWVRNMKELFASWDSDKDGRVRPEDITTMAKKLAMYGNLGKEGEKRCFDTLNDILSFAFQGRSEGANEEEFVQGMKALPAQPDARKRVCDFAAMLFELIDTDRNGVISLDEFIAFHKASDSKIDEELQRRVFNEADTNGDGVIQPSEWEETMCKFHLPA